MANIGAYSRHKFFNELDEPLFTNNGDGATPLVYTPNEQRARCLQNLTGDILTLSTDGAGDDAIELTKTSTSTDADSSVEPFSLATTMSGVGGVGGRAKFSMTTNVALGSWSNALKAEVVYGAAGRTNGLGSAVVAEMTLSAGTSQGTYALYEGELNMGTGALTGTLTSLYHASVNGADAATFDANGYILNLQGLTAGATDAFSTSASIGAVDEITAGLKVRIGAADYFILLATAADFAD